MAERLVQGVVASSNLAFFQQHWRLLDTVGDVESCICLGSDSYPTLSLLWCVSWCWQARWSRLGTKFTDEVWLRRECCDLTLVVFDAWNIKAYGGV